MMMGDYDEDDAPTRCAASSQSDRDLHRQGLAKSRTRTPCPFRARSAPLRRTDRESGTGTRTGRILVFQYMDTP